MLKLVVLLIVVPLVGGVESVRPRGGKTNTVVTEILNDLEAFM